MFIISSYKITIARHLTDQQDAWTLRDDLAESEDSGDECKPWEADPHLGWRGQNGRRPVSDPVKVETHRTEGLDKGVPVNDKQPAGKIYFYL